MTAPELARLTSPNPLPVRPLSHVERAPVLAASPAGDRRVGLVLSLFPGIGLLDAAFEDAGFCVVRGPDLLWGGDIDRFHPPAGVFDGIIGGPPCQSWSGLGSVNRARWGEDCMLPDKIPAFARCIDEAQPAWFVMENVPQAPAPDTPDYEIVQRICNNRWCGGEQNRVRRFTFGAKSGASRFHIRTDAIEPAGYRPAVVSTGQAGRGGARASIESMARDQGVDPARFEHSPFSVTELRRAIANGVPYPMARAVAEAVKACLSHNPLPLERVA
jgi:DNA (cytosine-5)-methyltransferase 1